MSIHKDNVAGFISFLRAAKWMSQSFYNTWLLSMPSEDDFKELFKKHG